MKQIHNRESGFTLMELVVVVVIIAVLTSLGIGSYTNVQTASRNLKRKADLKELKTALEMFRSANGAYPSTGGAWWGACSGYGSRGDTGANGYIPDLAPGFVSKLPHDPREGRDNTGNGAGCIATQTCYLYNSNGTDYKLLAHCTPEGPIQADDPYLDSARMTTSWQVSSSATAALW